MYLIDNLTLGSLLHAMIRDDIINRRQYESITSYNTISKQIKVLIAILQHRSIKQYYQFLACLKETGQGFIAEELENEDDGGWYINR